MQNDINHIFQLQGISLHERGENKESVNNLIQDLLQVYTRGRKHTQVLWEIMERSIEIYVKFIFVVNNLTLLTL